MNFESLSEYCKNNSVSLVAVSKTKPANAINELYAKGQRIFGENKVQEVLEKIPLVPNDVEWHLIGHLQTNKVKQIIPHASLIHSVDSLKLLAEIEKEAKKINKKISVLLQIYIAKEESKYGLDNDELEEIIELFNNGNFPHIHIKGLMGMASFTDNTDQVRKEFKSLKLIFNKTTAKLSDNKEFKTLSMGMSGDYEIAVEEGSNMIRIGSLLFGYR